MKFQDLLRENRITHWTEGKYCRPGWVQFHCPFCFGRTNPEKPYCGYNIAYNYVNCWACGPHSVAKTVMTLTGLSYREIKGQLDNLDSVKHEEKVHRGKLILPEGLGPLLKRHGSYLRGRGFKTKELKDLWRIQGLGKEGKRAGAEWNNLAWRIFIPVIWRGEIVSWTTRSLIDEGMRYMSAGESEEAIPHKHLLYGEDYATTAISIHEGPIDVWKIGPGAVATLGTGFTPAQVLRMSKYPRRIVCFDSEPAAQKRARKLCSLLEVFPGETFNVTLDAKDAGGASEGELSELRSLLR